MPRKSIDETILYYVQKKCFGLASMEGIQSACGLTYKQVVDHVIRIPNLHRKRGKENTKVYYKREVHASKNAILKYVKPEYSDCETAQQLMGTYMYKTNRKIDADTFYLIYSQYRVNFEFNTSNRNNFFSTRRPVLQAFRAINIEFK